MRSFAAAAACLLLGACCVFSGPGWTGPPTDHFDGRRFHNEVPARVSVGKMMRWRLSRRVPRWPRWIPASPGQKPPQRVREGELRVTMVNHSTTLIQVDGVNLLTDPIWGDVAGPVPYLVPHRRAPPGLRFEDLPPIDAVLISHDHYDHLDIPTLERLVTTFRPRILAGLGQGRLLAQWGIHGVVELDWWQWAAAGRLRVWAVPARHGCRRGFCDDDVRLWLGFVIRSPHGDVYFAGDTGWGSQFQRIVDRFGPPRLALLPIGPGEPRDLFAPVHLDAADAVLAATVLRASLSVPTHFGTFPQGDELPDEPERKLRRELEAEDTPPFAVLHNGEAIDVTSPRGAEGS